MKESELCEQDRHSQRPDPDSDGGTTVTLGGGTSESIAGPSFLRPAFLPPTCPDAFSAIKSIRNRSRHPSVDSTDDSRNQNNNNNNNNNVSSAPVFKAAKYTDLRNALRSRASSFCSESQSQEPESDDDDDLEIVLESKVERSPVSGDVVAAGPEMRRSKRLINNRQKDVVVDLDPAEDVVHLGDRVQDQNRAHDDEDAENRPKPGRGHRGRRQGLWRAVRELETDVHQMKVDVRNLKVQHTEYDAVLVGQQVDLQEHAGQLVHLHKENDARKVQLEKHEAAITELKLPIRIPKEGYECDRCFKILSTKQTRKRHMENFRIHPQITESTSNSEDDDD